MNNKWIVSTALFALVVSTQLFAAANAPIQRVDVVNLLGAIGGATPTSVVVAFKNDLGVSCLTTTLPYQGAISVLAGKGQTCGSVVTSLSVTPMDGSMGAVYETPISPTPISSSLYSTQAIISQYSAPSFDPNSGELVSPGTLQVGTVSHLANN